MGQSLPATPDNLSSSSMTHMTGRIDYLKLFTTLHTCIHVYTCITVCVSMYGRFLGLWNSRGHLIVANDREDDITQKDKL